MAISKTFPSDLIHILGKGDPDREIPGVEEAVVASALAAAAESGGAQGVEAIAPLLGHPHPRLREYAFYALTRVPSPEIFPHLFQALQGEDGKLKELALGVVKVIGKKQCLRLIKDMLSSDRQWRRQVALGALDRFSLLSLRKVLSEKQVVEVLENTLAGHEPPALKYPSHFVEDLVAREKTEEDGPGPVPFGPAAFFLLSAMAVEAVSRGDGSVASLASLANHPREEIREGARLALTLVPSPRACSRLFQSLLDEPPAFQGLCSKWMEVLGRESFLRLLGEMLHLEEDWPRETGLAVLERLRESGLVTEKEVMEVFRNTLAEGTAPSKASHSNEILRRIPEKFLPGEGGDEGGDFRPADAVLAAMLVGSAVMQGEPAVDVLLPFLSQRDSRPKTAAFHALTLIPSPAAYAWIFQCLLNGDGLLRELSTRFLRASGKPGCIRRLRETLASTTEWRRQAALATLSHFHRHRVLSESEVVEILRDSVLSAPRIFGDEGIRALARMAEGGSARAESALEEIHEAQSPREEPAAQEKESPGSHPVRRRSPAAGFLALLKRWVRKPLDLAAQRPYWVGGGAAFLLAAGLYANPGVVKGDGVYVEFSKTQARKIGDHLKKLDYHLNKRSNGNWSLFYHKYWYNSSDSLNRFLEHPIIFSAYSDELKNSEIFAARATFDGTGGVREITRLENLTRTPSTNEYDLISLESSYAYVSDIEEGKILTIEDAKRENQRQFFFRKPVDITRIFNSPLGRSLVKVEAVKNESETFSVHLNVDSGTVEPEDFPVEYIPHIEGEEPFVPAMVEKARSLPFVGKEKIARLEDIYYQTTDYVKRKLYETTDRAEAEGPLRAPPPEAAEKAPDEPDSNAPDEATTEATTLKAEESPAPSAEAHRSEDSSANPSPEAVQAREEAAGGEPGPREGKKTEESLEASASLEGPSQPPPSPPPAGEEPGPSPKVFAGDFARFKERDVLARQMSGRLRGFDVIEARDNVRDDDILLETLFGGAPAFPRPASGPVPADGQDSGESPEEKAASRVLQDATGESAASESEIADLARASIEEIATSASELPMAPLSLAPPRIIPLFENAKEGEGIWSSDGLPNLNGDAGMYVASVRVDKARPYAVMHFVSFDLTKVDLHLMPGTQEPVSSVGLKGKGRIPPRIHSDLVCTFNGGFRTQHGQWGFVSRGVTYLPPVKGIATIAVDGSGKVRMGTWGESLAARKDYAYLRQNLPPLVEDGKVNEKRKHWGGTVGGKTHVWRSALGMTRDRTRLIYGVGNSLSHKTLGEGMIMADCDYAMQLDINDYHTYFFFYRQDKDSKGNLRPDPFKLTDEMIANERIGLIHYVRDFFYMTWKPSGMRIANRK